MLQRDGERRMTNYQAIAEGIVGGDYPDVDVRRTKHRGINPELRRQHPLRRYTLTQEPEQRHFCVTESHWTTHNGRSDRIHEGHPSPSFDGNEEVVDTSWNAFMSSYRFNAYMNIQHQPQNQQGFYGGDGTTHRHG